MTKIESVVKNALLNGKDFSTKRGWTIRVTADDNVEIWPPQGEGRSTTLAYLDKAVSDFCRQADVMAPGVNQTNPPKSTSDGSLGKDTSGKSPKKFDPSVNKTPKPDGSFTDKSLGTDTSTDEGFSTPSVNKDMTPDDEGLTDTDLGSDSSGNSTKFDNKVVNVQSDGRTGNRRVAWGAKDMKAAFDFANEGHTTEEIAEFLRARGVDDRGVELILNEVEVQSGDEFSDYNNMGKGKRAIQDTFANGPDPSEIYRKLNAKKVSKELLAGILNEEEWEAQQRLAQMDKMSPKRGPGMPGKGKATYSEGDAGGQIGAEEEIEAGCHGSPKSDKKSTKTAGPKLREKWLNDGGYHREIESESAEELHALVQGFSGEDVDWAKFKPAMPDEKEAEEVQQQPVQEGAGAAPITAKRAQGYGGVDLHKVVYAQEEGGSKNRVKPIYEDDALAKLEDEETGERTRIPISDLLEFYTLSDMDGQIIHSPEEQEFDYTEKNAQSADIEAIDEDAKETIKNYMGEYGKELTKDDGAAPKGKNPKKMLDKGKKAQAAPPTAPAPAPAAPGGPGAAPAPGGQAPAPGAPAPKAPAPKAPQGLQPGVGDAGIQALGWTAEDVQSMTDDQKKGILQLKLTKPGTQPKQQMPEKAPAPKTPAPGGPAAPAGPAAPGSEPAPPAPSAPSPKAVKGAKKVKRGQAAPLPQTEEAPAAPAQDAPQSPAAPPKAPATPAAPKGPAKPAGQPAQDPGQAGGGQEQQAFQILQEVQQAQVNAVTPNEVGTAKVSMLLQRLLTELGITPDEASKLFGLQRGNFGTLFK